MTVAALLPAVASSYGLDCSFPIHHQEAFDDNTSDCPAGAEAWKERYHHYMEGCHRIYSVDEDGYDVCEDGDAQRLAMNRDQPKSMLNLTDTGYKHMEPNEKLKELLTEFWEKNKESQQPEEQPEGSVHTNHWDSPASFVSVNDDDMIGATDEFRDAILDAIQPVIEEWTGMKQHSTSLYGVRVYQEGSILSPHCDRLPLVSSAIVNVAQDVDEDWPLEVYDREGNAHNITMKPGDVVLYESGSVIHGRPFPLKGRYYANIFIHFEPIGFMNGDKFEHPEDPELPPYLVPESSIADEYKNNNYVHHSDFEDDEEEEFGHHDDIHSGGFHDSPSLEHEDEQVEMDGAHLAAAEGDIEALQAYARDEPDALHRADESGWKPIHEAVRAGHHEAARLLLEHGADHNERTFFGNGESPLNMALSEHGDDHPITKLLLDRGAIDIPSTFDDYEMEPEYDDGEF